MIIATSLIFLLRIMLESTHKWKKNHDRKGRRIISDHDRKGRRIISDPIDISANNGPRCLLYFLFQITSGKNLNILGIVFSLCQVSFVA